MIFSGVVPFKRKKKKIPDLSLPPCIAIRVVGAVLAIFHRRGVGVQFCTVSSQWEARADT
jgi:hypothetical protein